MRKITVLLVLISAMICAFPLLANEGFPGNSNLLKTNPYNSLWGDRDTEIYLGYIDGFSFATNYSNGDIYAIVNANINNDSLIFLKSTDNGEHWKPIHILTITADWFTYNPQIFYTDNDRIALFTRFKTPADDYDIWLWEAEDSADVLINNHWEQVDDVLFNVDSIYSYDVDYADNYYYVTYLGIDTSYSDSISVISVVCHEDSSYWSNGQGMFFNPRTMHEPRISAGPNGNAYIAFIDERLTAENQIRVKRTYDYGVNWLGSQQVSSVGASTIISNVDIAASRNTSYQSVWFTVQYDNYATLGYYYSQDSCATTSYGGVLMDSVNNWIPKLASIACHPTADFLTMALLYDSVNTHDIYFTWASEENPDSFYAPVKISQYNATGVLRPFAGNILGYSAIAYAGWGPENAYFDYFGSILGIGENIITSDEPFFRPSKTVFTDNIEFNMTLYSSSAVKIEIFDCSGRMVTDRSIYLDEGSNIVNINTSALPGGIYLYRAYSNDNNASGKIIKLK